jgi:hypothetical protein
MIVELGTVRECTEGLSWAVLEGGLYPNDKKF